MEGLGSSSSSSVPLCWRELWQSFPTEGQKSPPVSNKKASNKQIEDIIFALKICKHVKSNAIVLAKNKQTIAIGSDFDRKTGLLKSNNLIHLNKENSNEYVRNSAFYPIIDALESSVGRKAEKTAIYSKIEDIFCWK